MTRIAAVVIGRNEAPRLARSLASVLRGAEPVVYVDSASGDASVDVAQQMGVDVVALDDGSAHSAARGRNAGFRRVKEVSPEVELVQFVDGDAELADAWLDAGPRALRERPDVGLVCGLIRERFPHGSLFHRLRDVAWDRTLGEIRGCGGIAMVRAAALEAVGGYDEEIAAGEDFDLCFRLRRRGWRTLRIGEQMAHHDLGDASARQWWKRAERDGRAYAHIVALHWRDPERLWVREWASIWFWGAFVPIATGGGLLVAGRLALLVLATYPALFIKTYRGLRRRGLDSGEARLYAVFCILGKLPQVIGQARFLSRYLQFSPSLRFPPLKKGGEGALPANSQSHDAGRLGGSRNHERAKSRNRNQPS